MTELVLISIIRIIWKRLNSPKCLFSIFLQEHRNTWRETSTQNRRGSSTHRLGRPSEFPVHRTIQLHEAAKQLGRNLKTWKSASFLRMICTLHSSEAQSEAPKTSVTSTRSQTTKRPTNRPNGRNGRFFGGSSGWICVACEPSLLLKARLLPVPGALGAECCAATVGGERGARAALRVLLGERARRGLGDQDLPTGHHLRRPEVYKSLHFGDLLEGAGSFCLLNMAWMGPLYRIYRWTWMLHGVNCKSYDMDGSCVWVNRIIRMGHLYRVNRCDSTRRGLRVRAEYRSSIHQKHGRLR